jgi:hypothetical protein
MGTLKKLALSASFSVIIGALSSSVSLAQSSSGTYPPPDNGVSKCIDLKQQYTDYLNNLNGACAVQATISGDDSYRTDIPKCKKAMSECDAEDQTSDLTDQFDKFVANQTAPADEKNDDLQKLQCPDYKDVGSDKSKSTACSTLTAQQQASYLKKQLSEKIEATDKAQSTADAGLKDLLSQQKECQKEQSEMGMKLSQAQLDMKSSSAEEMTEVGGLNVQLTQKLSELQTQIELGITDLASINGPELTHAESVYQMAIAKAQSDCHANLVKAGAANKLTYNTLQDAINASQVGITSFKCDRDFDTQTARSLALQALNQNRQELQVKFLQAQTRIAALNREVASTKSSFNIQRQALITKFTNRIANDQSTITSAMQSLQNAEAMCQKQNIAQTQTLADAKGLADEAKGDKFTDTCQLKFLKAKYKATGSQPEESSTKKLDDQQAIINIAKTDPCLDACKNITQVCSPEVKQGRNTTAPPAAK